MHITRTSGFHTTRWTLIQSAALNPTTDSRQALEMLCQTYWQPVYAFIRRNGYDPDESQDLTQDFFAVLIKKNYLVTADPKRGRFRSFLLTSVKHFLANEWNRAHALKRGGHQVPVSIDAVEAERWYAPETVEDTTPETVFERRWALSLLERVIVKLRAEYDSAGKTDLFENLSVFLNQDYDDAHYQKLAVSTGMSAGALRMAVYRLRRRYRLLLRAEIAETVSMRAEIDEEIHFLMSALLR
jgi:RNA polymerase sigma-70 factor (ECF subfamily)